MLSPRRVLRVIDVHLSLCVCQTAATVIAVATAPMIMIRLNEVPDMILSSLVSSVDSVAFGEWPLDQLTAKLPCMKVECGSHW